LPDAYWPVRRFELCIPMALLVKELELRDSVNRCVRCARCKKVCPVYRATHDERAVARGKLMLLAQLLSGEIPPSKRAREILDTCLMCHQCTSICPVGINIVELFVEGRSRFKRPGMRSLLTRLMFRFVLPSRTLYNLLMRFARWLQKIMPTREPGLRHIPLLFEGKRGVPQLARHTALRELPPSAGSGRRVALFLGCLLNYVYPSTASNAVKLLTQAGFEVVVPQGQLCCGLASLYTGDTKTAGRLARRNTSVFRASGAEYIVTACANCATMFKQHYPQLLREDCSGSARVMEICEFLAAQGYTPHGQGPPVTYHDPCHLRFAQGVSEQPRKLLSAVAELREPAEPGRCCGGGGTLPVFHYNLSREIGLTQAKLLAETGAEMVATACPGCMLALAGAFEGDMRVCHVVDFIAAAQQGENCIGQGNFVATAINPKAS